MSRRSPGELADALDGYLAMLAHLGRESDAAILVRELDHEPPTTIALADYPIDLDRWSTSQAAFKPRDTDAAVHLSSSDLDALVVLGLLTKVDSPNCGTVFLAEALPRGAPIPRFGVLPEPGCLDIKLKEHDVERLLAGEGDVARQPGRGKTAGDILLVLDSPAIDGRTYSGIVAAFDRNLRQVPAGEWPPNSERIVAALCALFSRSLHTWRLHATPGLRSRVPEQAWAARERAAAHDFAYAIAAVVSSDLPPDRAAAAYGDVGMRLNDMAHNAFLEEDDRLGPDFAKAAFMAAARAAAGARPLRSGESDTRPRRRIGVPPAG